MNTICNTSFLATLNSTTVRYINLKNISITIARTAMRAASVIAPRYAVKQALEKFLTPPRHVRPLAEQRLLESATPFLVATPHGNIAAWRFGKADDPVVLMSHGWGGRGAQFRHFVPTLLAAHYQVVLFDHLGHGVSEGRDSSLVLFWRGLEAVQAELLREGHSISGLVSHSLGGAAVGCMLRAQHRTTSPLPRVVMIAPPSSLIGYSNLFARYMGISERIRHAMQWRVEQRYGVAWQAFELPESVNTIAAPALIIHDRDDRMVRIDSGMAVARAWPDARFHATEGLGHQQILRNQDVVQHTLDFLSDRVTFQLPEALGKPIDGEHRIDEPVLIPQPAPLY